MTVISQRYAQAIFEYSQENKILDYLYQDLKDLAELLDQQPLLEDFFRSPIISSLKRQKVLKNLFEGRIHPMTLQFLELLEQKKRLFFIKNICQDFENLYLDTRGILRIKATSSVPLEDTELRPLKHHLKSKFTKEIELSVEIDPKIIGGLKIQIEDRIYDSSLRRQLEKFKELLIS